MRDIEKSTSQLEALDQEEKDIVTFRSSIGKQGFYKAAKPNFISHQVLHFSPPSFYSIVCILIHCSSPSHSRPTFSSTGSGFLLKVSSPYFYLYLELYIFCTINIVLVVHSPLVLGCCYSAISPNTVGFVRHYTNTEHLKITRVELFVTYYWLKLSMATQINYSDPSCNRQKTPQVLTTMFGLSY